MDHIKDDFTGDDRLNQLLDGNLQTEDGYVFRIHKFKLAENYKYFYALFCGMEKDKNDFLIPGINGKVLSNILSYIYSGNIHITSENISELMIASDYLMVDGILAELKIFMENNLSINNCIPFLGTAFTINREDFFKDSYRFVQTNFERVIRNGSIETFDLPLNIFKQLLSDRNLCISSEMTVFISIVQWVSVDSSERLALVPNLIQYLMVSAIDEDSAIEILQHAIVAENAVFEHINNIKSFFSSSLEVIKYYFQSLLQLEFLPVKRIPPKLTCVALHDIQNFDNPTQIYLTYDEQIDLWRKISVVDFDSTVFLFYIDDSIYMFDELDASRNFRYSIVDRQVHEMSAFVTARSNYVVVDLEGHLYVLGGRSDEEDKIYSVEIYDSDLNQWHTTSSMIPISTFAAASLNNHIYVVGRSTDEGDEMIAQVFDASTETWSLLPAPLTEGSDFTMVSYLEKIYVIGGDRGNEYSKAVESFDPAKNEWRIETSLPHGYFLPTARVFQDLLMVFDDCWDNPRPDPAVFYNNEEERWEFFEESSPLKNAAHSFQFFTIDKEEYIDILTRENRQSDIHFEKSPFA